MKYLRYVLLDAWLFVLRQTKAILCTYTLLVGIQTCLYAQNETDISTQQMVDMDLSDLLQMKVVSASKKPESVFDASLSISSISREEIQNAGATSVMEALRLVPGVLVVEMTNGNYNVFLRGFSNLPPGASLSNSTNSITLVMIDNRPVYNYFNGGTFWETLPVDLNDVERIEVVRGPSAPLYGPNAAMGVINIITRKLNKEGLSTWANVQGGFPATAITNASAGYKTGKFSVIASGNFQQRQRTEDDYYVWTKKEKVPVASITSYYPDGPLMDKYGNVNINERYPDPALAQRKFGYNAFLNYDLSEKSAISLSLGGQGSQVQKAFSDELSTPITTSLSNSNYADAKLKLGNLRIALADQFGTQDISKGSVGYKIDFNTIDGEAEYDFKIGNLAIRPGVNVRNAVYDDSKYCDISAQEGFINGRRELSNIAGSLRGEYTFKDRLNLMAAGRVDKYNYPDRTYISYQFAASYKLNGNNILRAVYSRSFRGPTFYDVYNNQAFYIGTATVSPGNTVPQYAIIAGNKQTDLQQIDMYELGYRTKLSDKWQLDLDLFYQTSQNYSLTTGGDSVVEPARVSIVQSSRTLPLMAKQIGGTLSVNYVQGKIQFKPFVTVQFTRLEGVSLYRDAPERNSTANYNVTYDTDHNGTPNVYGGFYLNYKLTEKLNVNLNGYYFSQHTYNNLYSNFAPDKNDGIVDIKGKLLLNAKVSYKIYKGFDVFANIRNLLNQTSYEFAQTDKIPVMVLVGASFTY